MTRHGNKINPNNILILEMENEFHFMSFRKSKQDGRLIRQTIRFSKAAKTLEVMKFAQFCRPGFLGQLFSFRNDVILIVSFETSTELSKYETRPQICVCFFLYTYLSTHLYIII